MAPRYLDWRLDELYPEERGVTTRRTGKASRQAVHEPGSFDKWFSGRDQRASEFREKGKASVEEMRKQWMGTKPPLTAAWNFVKPDKPLSGRQRQETFTPDQPWSTHLANPEFNKLTPGEQGGKRKEHLLNTPNNLTKLKKDTNTDNISKIPNSKDLPEIVKTDTTKPSKWNTRLQARRGTKVKTAEIKAQEGTKDTTSTNLGAKDIAGKLLSSGSGDISKAYKMVQTGKHLWKMAQGAKAATAATTAAGGAAGGAGMAALGPLGIAAAVGLAMFSKKDEKPASPNLRYGGIQEEDYYV